MWRLRRLERVKTADLGVYLAVAGVFAALAAIYFIANRRFQRYSFYIFPIPKF